MLNSILFEEKIIEGLNEIKLLLAEVIKVISKFSTSGGNIFFSPVLASVLGASLAGLISWGITNLQLRKNNLISQQRDFHRIITDLKQYLPTLANNGILIGRLKEVDFLLLKKAFLELMNYYFTDPDILSIVENHIFPLGEFITNNYFPRQFTGGRIFYIIKVKEMRKEEMLEHFRDNASIKKILEEKYKDENIIPISIREDVNPGDRAMVEKYMIDSNIDDGQKILAFLLEGLKIVDNYKRIHKKKKLRFN